MGGDSDVGGNIRASHGRGVEIPGRKEETTIERSRLSER